MLEPTAQKMNIAIIGGGIAGLTCLHKLAKVGIKAELFEASSRLGGRIYTFKDAKSKATLELGAGYFHKYYVGFLKLLEELGLKDHVEPKGKDGVAIAFDGQSISISSPKHIIRAVLNKKMSVRDVISLLRLRIQAQKSCSRFSKWVSSFLEEYQPQVDFHTSLLYDPWYRENSQKSFSEFIKTLSPRIQEFIRSIARKQLFQAADELSLAIGSFLIGSAATQLYIVKGGMEKLPQKIYSLYQSQIHLNSPIQEVYYQNKKWNLKSSEGIKTFDLIVLATPIPVAQKLFGFQTKLEYSRGNLLIVRGKLKPSYSYGNNIYIIDQNTGISGITRYGKDLFKVGVLENPNLDEYFESYEIVHTHVWEFATPMITPQTKLPYASQIANLYFIGDYQMPCMEVAVNSAALVAEHIARTYKP